MSLINHKILPVAVVDTFKRHPGLGGLSFSHGESVEAFLGNEIQAVRFDTERHIEKAKEAGNSWQVYPMAFQELRDSIRHGNKYSALNISSGFSFANCKDSKVLAQVSGSSSSSGQTITSSSSSSGQSSTT